MKNQVWLLIDCNNFFVSCERAFRPDLWKKPVLVLSANDGCVVSRSQEVKDLGIGMGVPLFQIKEICQKHHIQIFSSNFPLYANFSNRVMAAAAQFATTQEIYSIDECFLEASHLNFQTITDWENFGLKIKNELWKTLGIPVTVGIASTKTLAKIATHIAKKDPLSRGVLSFQCRDKTQITSFLNQIAVNDVWGIGRQSAKFLFENKIFTVTDFLQQPITWVRKNLRINGEKTWLELKGTACILNEVASLQNQALTCSRSFNQTTTQFSQLQNAISTFTAQAARRLRRHHHRASLITVFISTSRYIEPHLRCHATTTLSLPQSSASDIILTSIAHQGLKKIFRSNFAYKKAGIILSGFESESAWQPDLISSSQNSIKEKLLMQSIDKINQQYGQSTLHLASQGIKPTQTQPWSSSSRFCSPRYLSSWLDLPQVR